MRLSFILVLTCLIFGQFSYAQKKKVIEKLPPAETPIDEETQLITYTQKLETSLPDSVLYKRALHWYNTEIESMRVDKEESVENKLIVAKGEFTLYGPKDNKGHQPKNGRIKYTMTTEITGTTSITKMTRFNKKATNYTPVEPWLEEQNEDYIVKYYLMNIEEQSGDVLRSYKKFVNVPMY